MFTYFFLYDKVRKLFFLRIDGWSDPRYTSDLCHSRKIAHSLKLKSDKIDEFRNFKTTFCKNFLNPGQVETRNVYSRVCIIGTDNFCLGVLSLLASVFK